MVLYRYIGPNNCIVGISAEKLVKPWTWHMQTSDIGTSHSMWKFQKKCNLVKARAHVVFLQRLKIQLLIYILFWISNQSATFFNIFFKKTVDVSLFEVILLCAHEPYLYFTIFFHFYPTVCKEGEENRQNVAQAYDYSQNSIAKNKPCKKSLKKVGYIYYNNSINHVGGV